MTRVIVSLGIAGLAVAAILISEPTPAQPGSPGPSETPSVAVCPVEEGSGRSTTISLVSTVNGPGRFTAFAGGSELGSAEFVTGVSGSSAVPVVDVAAVGVAAGLVEFPSVASAAGALVLGTQSFSADVCPSTPFRQTLLAGGSTLSGQEFDLQLMNPYAGEAIVDIAAVSDSGVESTDRLDGIVVPPRSSIVLELDDILPGREFLSLIISTAQGSVIAFGRMEADSDSAIWGAVPGAQDWFVPLPRAAGRRQIVISTDSAAEVAYQIDLYGPEGLIPAFEEGVIQGGGSVSFDVDAAAPEASGIRVIAAAPIAAFIKVESATGLGITSGVTAAATRWLLPGALVAPESRVEVLVINPGTEDAAVVVTERRVLSTAWSFSLSADSAISFSLPGNAANGVAVDSDFPVAVLWVSDRGDSIALSAGTPTSDG